MILKPAGLIATRDAVQRLAAHTTQQAVTEIDMSAAIVYGLSTMHEFVRTFPHATITGLDGHNAELYERVTMIEARRAAQGSDE